MGLCASKVWVRRGVIGGVSKSGEVELIMIANGLPYELAGGYCFMNVDI